MTNTAATFSLTSLETGRRVGTGIICAEVRYAAVFWVGTSEIDRCYEVSPAAWRKVGREINVGLYPDPLPSSSALALMLTGRGLRARTIVRWQRSALVEIRRPDLATTTLDAWLREMAGHSAADRPMLPMGLGTQRPSTRFGSADKARRGRESA